MSRFAPARSALADYPGGRAPDAPTITLVIPVYNERDYIRTVAAEVLAQDYPGIIAIYFVDGQSEDGTTAILHELQRRDPRICVVQNPRRNQAAAFNLVFPHAATDLVMRLDGHARYSTDVVRRSVEALLATGAGGVGAIPRPLPAATLIGQSIVAAHHSKLGIGVARHRQESSSGWVETVWNGCYWKHVVDQVGCFREDLPRTEDNDFHARLRALGYGLYLAPAIKAFYAPRQSLGALWRQYQSNGIGIAQTLATNPRAVSLHHLVPGVFVLTLLLLVLLALIWRPGLLLLALLLLVYLAALLLFSAIAWRKQPGAYALLLPVVFLTLHGSYGWGTVRGLLPIPWK